SGSEDQVKGFEAGAVDYVTKPIQIEEVIARVNLHLKLYFLNQELEQRVEERTAKLNATLQELKQSQLQLVQSEKMSALGQLMAGVTHEINNPIGFVAGNLNHIENYLQDLIEHLQLYQQAFPEPGEEIEEHAEEIELDYLLEDCSSVLSSMRTGMDRIRDISTSMRIFSRADKDQTVSFDIHEGLDSTLLILKHRLKAKDTRPEVEIIKNYGKVPEIQGFPGQLNQVFMNIIANAVDVFDEMSESIKFEELKAHSCKIYIYTSTTPDNQQAIIKIKDNGCGMPEEVRDKIFDHLFTTKAVGKGTGLGLSIARQIVEEKHGGSLSCFSQIDQGTEFIMELPIAKFE
ncbi:MAG: ATP-binding protein, partial [Cyanobacteriota bacterium]|nr:ATP-binding protein [Cyanobacteriota bacterium]